MSDQLYVCGYNGPASRWYQSAMAARRRIAAAGRQWDVSVEAAQHDLNDVVDAAYRQKYPANPYLSHMIGSNARAVTVQISLRAD